MWMTNLVVERSLTVATVPERAWSLLSSPAAFSMQPGTFAFDLRPATGGAGSTGGAGLWLGIAIRQARVLTLLFGISEETPGQVISLRLVNVPPRRQLTYTLSVRPGQRTTKIAIGVSEEVSRSAKADLRARWLKDLDVWLANAQAVLEGRKPWPGDELPPSVRAECARRREVADPVSAEASTVIAAPPARVWQTVWDPATNGQISLTSIASGHVPGTPIRQPGEMQYEIQRASSGLLVATLMTLHDCEEERRAVVQTVSPFATETVYLIEPEPAGTRLTLTASLPGRAFTAGHAAQDITEHVARYKSFIEEPEHAAGGPPGQLVPGTAGQ
ncbi:MAG TPA: hypothetical protein VHY58_13600 [Streptosporangiaceae bacterium]|jgi:hypothetical protein|nr:hypothetical protein [Streptosporangiaceae bacterium]